MKPKLTFKLLDKILAGEFRGDDAEDRLQAARDKNAGLCLACHAVASEVTSALQCEPDAEGHECAVCGEKRVFSINEIDLYLLRAFSEIEPKLTLESLQAILAEEFGTETLDDGLATARDESAGLCLSCHAVAYECEPDARGYECEACGARKVYGVEEISLRLA
jgi:hypothetical protein